MTYYIYLVAQIGLSILFVWSVIKIGILINKKQASGRVKYGIILSVSTLCMAGLVVYIRGNLLGMGVTIITIILYLLGWSIVKISGRTKRKEGLRASHFIISSLLLVGLQLIYCLYMAVKIGLGHGSVTLTNQLPLQYSLFFLVIVALPIAGLVLYQRMRSKRVLAIFLLVIFFLIGLSSVYFSPGVSARLVDYQGNPITDAYVFYSRYNHFLFSDWANDYFTRTDKQGDFSIPPQIHINLPFEYSFGFEKPGPDALAIKIYAPDLYNYFDLEDAYTWSYKKESGAILSIDKSRTPVTISPVDRRHNPQECLQTLNQLVHAPVIQVTRLGKASKRELVSIINRKYEQLELEYGKGKDTRASLKGTGYGRTLKEEIALMEEGVEKKRTAPDIREVEEEPVKDFIEEPLVPPGSFEGSWSTYGANPGHSRCIQGQALHIPTRVKGFKQNVTAQEILFEDINKDGVQDLVICGLGSIWDRGDVAGIDGNTRKVIWKLDFQSEGFSLPLIRDGILYFTTKKKEFRGLNAIDIFSGRLLWRYQPSEADTFGIVSFPELGGECIYYCSGTKEKTEENMYRPGSHIFALDKKKGELRWKLKTDARASASPVIVSDKLCFYGQILTTRPYIACVDLQNREVSWKFHLDDNESPWTVFLVGAGDVVLCSHGSTLYALDIQKGQLKWKYKSPQRIGSFAAVKDNFAYFNSMGVYALDIANGRLKWEFATQNLFSSSPCIIGEVLYTGDVNGYVYALRLEDGQKLWEYKIGGAITSISTIGPVIAVIAEASTPGIRDLYLLREENFSSKKISQ
jgi:outer membrane protein assembly factor BamB